MFRPLIKLYARDKSRFILILSLISLAMVLSAITLHIYDNYSNLNRDKIYTQRRLSELYSEYSRFNDQFLESNSSDFTNFYSQNPILKRFGCNVIAFVDDEIVYSSSNIVNSEESIKKMLSSDKKMVKCESMVAIPVVKHNNRKKSMLVIRLADIYRDKDSENLLNNPSLFRSSNLKIVEASSLCQNIELPSGDYTFSFSLDSKSDPYILTEILLLIGVILALVAIRAYIFSTILNPKKSIRLYVFSFLSIALFVTLLYIIEISNFATTIFSIVILAYALMSIDMIKKSLFVRDYDQIDSKIVKRIVVALIFAITATLSILISQSFNDKIVVVFYDLLPITFTAISLIAILIASNMLFINSTRKKEVILLILLTIVSTFTLGYFDINLSAIFLILSLNVLIFFVSNMYFSNLKMFCALFVIIALICSYKIYIAESVQAFGEQFTISSNSYTHNFYDVLNFKQHQTYIYSTLEDKINWSFAIFMYILFLFLGIGIFTLRDKLFFTGFKGTNIPENLPTIIYATMFLIITVTTLVGKVFIKNIREDYVDNSIKDSCNAICQDYRTTSKEITKWLEHIDAVFDIDLELYSTTGTLLLTSDSSNVDIIPKQIGTQLLDKIKQSQPYDLTIRSGSRFLIPFYSVYILVDDSHIIRIPFAANTNHSKYSSTLTKFINIFVLVIIISLLYLAISYSKYSKPIRALKLNVGAIRLRKHILITSAMKNSYEINYMFNEYNKMIKELEDQHQLQITIERQATWNKISKMLAHEIKNPLTPILLTSQLSLSLKKQNNPKWVDTIDDTLNTVIEQTKRISTIISEIMDESDKFNFKGNSVDILAIIDDICHFYAAYDNINMSVENTTHHDTLKVGISHDNLWSVITNITTNGIDAINSRGIEKGAIKFKISSDDKLTTLSISNNGEPIPSAYINEIFGYKFSTKKNGHGLGLFLSNHIIKMAGGEIYINKSDQKSTEFIIKLPTENQI